MDAAKERMLDNMEKNKTKQRALSQSQMQRIWKREEEAFTKKHLKIQEVQAKQDTGQKRAEAFGRPSKQAALLKDKVESKLLQETKAQLDKKRAKFDPKQDGPGRDAHTMGGNVLGT